MQVYGYFKYFVEQCCNTKGLNSFSKLHRNSESKKWYFNKLGNKSLKKNYI